MRYTSNPEMLDVYNRSSKFTFVSADITNPDVVAGLVKATDYVVHLAAETFVDSSIAGSRLFWEVNVLGTHELVEAVRRSAVQKLVHVSTDEVWGQALAPIRFVETSPYAPRNPYSASKAAADHLVRAAANTYGVPFNIVHFTNLYGPYQYPEKLIPKAIAYLMRGNKIPIYSDGSQEREWMHVDDAVTGLLSVLWDAPLGEAYALGGGECLTNMTVIQTLLRIMGGSEDDLVYVDDRPGHDFRYAVDASKAEAALGWSPRRKLLNDLPELVDWYRSDGAEWLRARMTS
jgi:dTDP-glucose 4,6-dehydratase